MKALGEHITLLRTLAEQMTAISTMRDELVPFIETYTNQPLYKCTECGAHQTAVIDICTLHTGLCDMYNHCEDNYAMMKKIVPLMTRIVMTELQLSTHEANWDEGNSKM